MSTPILTRAQLEAKHARDEERRKARRMTRRKKNAKKKARKTRVHLAKAGRRANRR